jgi:copper chaperone
MSEKTVTVPNISCDHCTHTIEMELGELPGVTKVQADKDSKNVIVSWTDPATWEKIEATLKEINYPPANLIQLN